MEFRMLITEALAELKTIEKRLTKKREYVRLYLYRPDGLRDPLEKEGGSQEVIKRELQAIEDLSKRVVAIRVAIQRTNLNTPLTVSDTTMSIAEWLAWRKEVSSNEQSFVAQMRHTIQTARNQAISKGASVIQPGSTAVAPNDIHVNVAEGKLSIDAERLEVILGNLDGQLSLKNATVQVEGI
jgi:hypothetical protein